MECKVNIPELGDRFTQLECMYMKGEPCSLEGCERKSQKRFREFVERMNRNAERIAKAFRTQKFDAVWDYV